MSKRLSLTEYRQANAIELSNDFIKSKHQIFEAYLIRRYMVYLVAFGAITEVMTSEYVGEYPTEADIEALIKKDSVEHCPH